MHFDVLVVGDFRFPAGTSSAIEAEVRALHRGGYSIGMMPVAGGVLRYPHPFNPRIARLLDEGLATLVPQRACVTAGLCALHHPQVFTRLPARPWNVRADSTVLVIHHPPVDATGKPSYDWAEINRVVTEGFGPVPWSPVGPKVRAGFRGVADAPVLTPDDWLNIIDVDDWRRPDPQPRGPTPIIGRHSRPDPQKWPDDRAAFLEVYPDEPEFRVRLMGYGPEIERVVGERPGNWEVLAFNAEPVRDFLSSIEFFVYYHGSAWIEAFGRSILESLASGVVTVLPRHFEPLFADGAIYAEPSAVRDVVRELHRDRAAFDRQGALGTEVVRAKFGPERAVERVEDRIGKPRGIVRASARPASRKILFFTSNGVGMGHIVRTLAVARRLPADMQPVVLSMSKAFGVCRADGVHSEYLPYHRSVGLEHKPWDLSLEAELGEIIAFHDPDVFVFDGNAPYPGLTRALDRLPGLWKVWQRRAMWRPDAGKQFIGREKHFDVVLEPGELAGRLDRGLTTKHRSRTVAVGPISYLRPGEALSRAEARAEIGLPEDGLAVLLQLGSGNNFSLAGIRDHAAARLRRHKGVHMVQAEWLIGANSAAPPPWIKPLRTFPFARYLAAFDCAVATSGYNTFHENIFACLPTLFVPNQHPEQDEQWLRARYAESRGLALTARSSDPQRVDAALSALLEPETRRRIRETCARLDQPEGAESAARYLANLAAIRRPWA